jgi:hypothetical protein
MSPLIVLKPVWACASVCMFFPAFCFIATYGEPISPSDSLSASLATTCMWIKRPGIVSRYKDNSLVWSTRNDDSYERQ